MGNTQTRDPAGRGGPGGFDETARESPLADTGLKSQTVRCQFFREVELDPIEQPGQPGAAMVFDRTLDELRLASFAVRRHHQAARHLIGHQSSEILPNNMQTQIDPGGAAGRGQYCSFVNVEHIRLYLDIRVHTGQLAGITPVCGGAFPVEEAGGGDHEHTRANGHQTGTPAMGTPESIEQMGRRHFLRISPAGYDNDSGAIELLNAVTRRHGQTSGGAQRTTFQSADFEVVPVLHGGARQPEKLHDDAEFKGAQTVVSESSYCPVP